jgi:hypothetical protein
MLLIVAALGSPVRGAESAASGNRFLFVVDASAAMKPLENPLRETLFDLIYSGARGRMTNGDTYGVWLVNERNDTSFPMETWKRQFAVELGAKAVSHLKDHGLKGKSHLELALSDAGRILKNVGDLTIILITDGEMPILGTPFDEEINGRWREVAPALKRAKATLNTALVAQDGEFVAWAVNSPDFLLEVPFVLPKPKPPKVEVSVTKTNPPAVAPVVVAPPKPRIAAAPIIITKESVAQERRSYVPATATNVIEPPSVVGTTNSPASLAVTNSTSTVAAMAATNISAAAATKMTNNAVAKNALPDIQASNPAPASPALPAAKIEPAVMTTASSLPIASSVEVKSPTNLVLWCIGAGAGGALLVLLCVAIVLRQARRQEPSLISQALARERIQTG